MESMVNPEFWLDRRVFITGGSGLVGSWLTKKLIALKADVVILLRDWVPQSLLLKENLLQQVTVVRGDLSHLDFLERVLAEYEIKTVFHLAAQTIVPIANHNPISTFESNICGTWNLLEACRRCTKNIAQIVVASSDKAYGEVRDLPYKETTPLNAIYPYDVSKACADMISHCFNKTWNLPVCVTRCGNFFGGGDLNWNRIIPGTIRSIIRNKPPVIRSNGKLIRDYIYIEDAVDAYLALAVNMSDNQALLGEVFNFSNSQPVDVLTLTNKIITLMNSELQPTLLHEANHEIMAQTLDSTKANKMLNWEPQFDLDQGLKNTISWYKEFFESNDTSLS